MIFRYKNGVLYNGDTIEKMDELIEKKEKVDLILTSPLYNTQRNLSDRSYDVYKDGIDRQSDKKVL